MNCATTLGLAGVAALLSTASLAADLAPLPRPVYAAPVAVVGGWYLRGYIGASNEYLKEITHPDFLTAQQFGLIDKGGFDAAPFGGGGIGYQWNNWFRVDATLEYRGFANFHALDRFFNPYQFSGPTFNTNQYTASKSELVGLVNVFLDLGTWWCITPFIGAGAGFAQVKIDHFRDVNVIAAGGGWADTGTKNQLRLGTPGGAGLQGQSQLCGRVVLPLSQRRERRERYAPEPRPHSVAKHIRPDDLPPDSIARHHARRALDAAAGAGLCTSAHSQGLSDKPWSAVTARELPRRYYLGHRNGVESKPPSPAPASPCAP